MFFNLIEDKTGEFSEFLIGELFKILFIELNIIKFFLLFSLLLENFNDKFLVIFLFLSFFF